MDLFLRSFWLSFVAMGLACSAVLHAWWSFPMSHKPPRPPFPMTRDNYIALYGDLGYSVHYLYRYGIFGMEKRLQEHDVLLIGPSHMELGLSAALLTERLSASMGRPVRVYNMGVGYGDSLAFDKGVLAANHIRNKAAIVDLYMPYGEDMSGAGKKASESSTLGAYLFVITLWLRATEDWLLDPWLPSLALDDESGYDRIKTARMFKMMTVRDWNTGDIVNIWDPEDGYIYLNSPRSWSAPFNAKDPLRKTHERDLPITKKLESYLTERDIHAIYTLIPYDGYLPNKIPSIAQPYVAIPPANLTLLDTMHLNGSSREIATEALAQALEKSGVLSPKDLPPPR